jgi:peptide/nickel transport system substrate-binding protein
LKKRVLLVPLAILLAISLMAIGCPSTPTTTPPTTPPPTTAPPTTPPPTGPTHGGVLRAIVTAGPMMMSYPPQMGPSDATYVFPAVERLVDSAYTDGVRHFEPFLCESYDIDPVAKTFTFNLRKGVKFHDGSEMTAEVVKWNFDLQKEGGWMQDADKVVSIEAVDDYTVVITFTEYSNQYEFNWGWTAIYSKAAWEAAAQGDLQAGIDWAVDHVVGTGPFKLVEYKRDVSLTYEKFDDYWQEGKPYLDGIEFVIIPDSVTAKAMLEAGEVDMWMQGSSARDWAELEGKGFHVQNYWPGLPQMLMGNTVDPESKWQDKRVREAVEYALDKATIAEALGLGYYKPLPQVSPDTEWGYDPNKDVHEYNPEMARQLLADAGYTDGCPVTLLIENVPPSIDAGEAIKSYLDEAGFICDLDIADAGRFYGSVFGTGWDDLLMMFYGMDVNYLMTYMSWFSHDPKSNLASFERTPEQIEMDKEAVLIADPAEQEAMCGRLVDYLYEEARFCPLWWVPATWVAYPYVHTDYFQQGFIRWKMADIWMEAH